MTMQQRFDVSILIPTHNRCQILSQTLESLRHLSVPQGLMAELIVVGNVCTDQTEQIVGQAIDGLPFAARYVAENEIGLNVARNRCVKEATGDILAFLDDDVWVEPDWLIGLTQTFRDYPADIVGGRVTLWWQAISEPDWISPAVLDRLSSNDHGDSVLEYSGKNLAIGANIAFRRQVFDTVGTFRPGLDRTGNILLGGGETELVRRALAAGNRFFYAPSAHVRHWVAPERLGEKYLRRVSFDEGRTGIFSIRKFGPKQLAYQLLGRLVQLIRYGCMELNAKIRSDKRNEMSYKIWRMHAIGGLTAIVQRLCRRSPVKN